MQLITGRLILREYVSADLDALLAYQADPRTREFYGPEEALPLEVVELLGTFIRWASEEPRQNWQLAIARRESPHQLIGSCGLRRAGAPHGSADLGVDLAPDAWGRGYGMEAMASMIEFGFRELELVTVRGETVSANARIAGLLLRLGFRRTGTRAEPEWMTDRGWTYVEWELGRSEWAGGAMLAHDG